MDIDNMSKEELELMGYDDIALLILQKEGHKMKLTDIFQQVCQLLELPENIIKDHLVEFFEQMSINKKFVMLDNGYWDLQSRHKPNLLIEDDLTEDDEIYDKDDFYDKDEEEPLEDDEELDDDDDVEENDLDDLMIVNDDEEEQ